jgi:hypothetical protein
VRQEFGACPRKYYLRPVGVDAREHPRVEPSAIDKLLALPELRLDPFTSSTVAEFTINQVAASHIGDKIHSVGRHAPRRQGSASMSSRKIDKAAADVDDALEIVEELEDEPDADKLDELHDTLDAALDSIDKVKKKDE